MNPNDVSNPALDAHYWESRYQQQDTPWDASAITEPLKTYIDNLVATEAAQHPDFFQMVILVPGAGSGYEAEYLHRLGFQNVWVVDMAQAPLQALQARVPSFEAKYLVECDFFKFEKENYFDLIIEQTFFCALNPTLRQDYVQKMASLLKPNGILAGLLFDFPLKKEGDPPYGGCKQEYETYFAPYFHIKKIEPCYNSIKPRAGKELFFILRKT
ncbi:methyltransferase domain-containing protein [Hugenholtzia roseola]|uniref:methyltransferase domain-containing protein n=1 Tax=Hugenholtzia roseola TaxID=1002 RepID=UPI000404140A|nr:methyltransferase domain-containing protein [Hugenholtzia roseola]